MRAPNQFHRNTDETGDHKMKTFFNKATAGLSGVVAICIGGVLAGIGLSVVALLAMFGLAAAGLILIAAPFVATPAPEDVTVDTPTPAASA